MLLGWRANSYLVDARYLVAYFQCYLGEERTFITVDARYLVAYYIQYWTRYAILSDNVEVNLMEMQREMGPVHASFALIARARQDNSLLPLSTVTSGSAHVQPLALRLTLVHYLHLALNQACTRAHHSYTSRPGQVTSIAITRRWRSLLRVHTLSACVTCPLWFDLISWQCRVFLQRFLPLILPNILYVHFLPYPTHPFSFPALFCERIARWGGVLRCYIT